MKVLNLYAGLGGNRKLWKDCEVTAIEYADKIATAYQANFPNDEVIVADAHKYLLQHYQDYDFIWSSPPCQSHSKMIRSGRNRKSRYPDMSIYEEILFLQYNFEGRYVVENVIPYYKPFLDPIKIGRHLFWSNFTIGQVAVPHIKDFINKQNASAVEELKAWLGLEYEGSIYYEGNHDPSQVLRNCVHPSVGLAVYKDMLKN
tara:strand:+ start:1626 stop:2231 length:606 start_codon:yes stop_codon:yes gene_type:complete